MSERRKAWVLRAAMIAASAGLVSACQTTSPYDGQGDPSISGPRAQYPIHAPADAPMPAAPAPVVQTPPPAPAYTPPPAPITSQPLPPPVYERPPAPVYEAPPAPPAPPQYRTVAGGPVEEADGPPKIYDVKSGDHLDSIARELGMTRKDLAEQNDLKEPYRLKPGQKLKGPATKGKAYVIQQGDTLSAIGRRFSVTSAALADENDMKTSDSLRPGKKLLLPKGYKDIGPGQALVTPSVSAAPAPVVVPPAPVVAPPKPAPVVVSPKSDQSSPTPAPAPTSTGPATPNPVAQTTPAGTCVATQQVLPPLPAGYPTPAQLKDLGKGKFAWPVRGGKVLSCFGPQPVRTIGPDQKAGMGVVNNGIDISANPNSAVRASAAGEVIHAEQVAGQGLTVIVRHPDGWITIYGNLSSLSVPKRDVAAPVADGNAGALTKVSAGQEIGRSGGTADGQALVHFEVRYSKDAANKPIDPELVLPPR
jgi:murein DD-endopeptidase MepM/ murein hydrolase activator NlpD